MIGIVPGRAPARAVTLLPHPAPFTTPFLGAVCTVVGIVVMLIAVWALSSARNRAR